MRNLLLVLSSLSLTACTPLLETDFELISEGTIAAGPTDLPGSPNGDRMIIADTRPEPTIVNVDGQALLFIYRDVLIQQPSHGSVFFDPLPAEANESIYFTWTGEFTGFEQTGGPPELAAKIQDLVGPDQPNLFSKFTIRLSSGAVTVQPSGSIETTVGFGVTGIHTVILRIDPNGRYALSVTGDGVNPNGGFSYEGSLGANVDIDPENIGLTLTFDDSLPGGVPDIYRVSFVGISQNTD